MTDARPRTAAANEAWRERGASSKARALLTSVECLSDRDLLALTERLVWECQQRGLDVPGYRLIPLDDEMDGPPTRR